MKLEEIRKLIESATPGPWRRRAGSTWVDSANALGEPPGGMSLSIKVGDSRDAAFIAAARDLLPKLLKVAEAAKYVTDNALESPGLRKLDEALAALEAD